MSLRAIILTGGRSTRFGGKHKPTLQIEGASVLQRIVTALRDLGTALGEPPELIIAGSAAGVSELNITGCDEELRVVREDPPFAGPLAGIAAGVDALEPEGSATVVILAGDFPFLEPDALARLVEASRARDTVAAPVDAEGYPQYLLSAWPERLLRAQLAALDTVENQPVRKLFRGVALAEVPMSARTIADIDSPADLRHWTEGH
ncbi:molybdenum cofactor guanylyltransferase [Gulosibacter chungangensis]|uniref:Molybdenum cofactor guanylyltransferase n=1 Tax=Gulosibacter chungangensis TaxID=979746 RepID=A0A7J5BDS0_9MICO|nr:molybdenum cofactor guanylyltransferase [Gulosibacter chungangensis]KAB1643438.1 molybdenum cofactor guanylyltransferase [Gulosibacter chungangensis]